MKLVKIELRNAAKEQSRLASDDDGKVEQRRGGSKRTRVAVDATFLRRLGIILKMCVTSRKPPVPVLRYQLCGFAVPISSAESAKKLCELDSSQSRTGCTSPEHSIPLGITWNSIN